MNPRILSYLKAVGIYLLAMVVGSLAVFVVESIGHSIYPLPEGVSMSRPESLKEYILNAPTMALLFPIIGHAIGSFASGMAMTWFMGYAAKFHVLVLGLIWMAIGFSVAISMPHPEWFKILDILVYVPMVYLGYMLSRKAR